jgi:hypothetical protein
MNWTKFNARIIFFEEQSVCILVNIRNSKNGTYNSEYFRSDVSTPKNKLGVASIRELVTIFQLGVS